MTILTSPSRCKQAWAYADRLLKSVSIQGHDSQIARAVRKVKHAEYMLNQRNDIQARRLANRPTKESPRVPVPLAEAMEAMSGRNSDGTRSTKTLEQALAAAPAVKMAA